MSDEKVKVTTLKGFNNEGAYAARNTVISVSEQRARELERNGLITRDAKRAAEPLNKKAPEPKNKAAKKAAKAKD